MYYKIYLKQSIIGGIFRHWLLLFCLGAGLPALVSAQAPAISSFSPASGPVGTLVTITGSNLNSPTAFTIGGTTALVISNTGTQLTGFVMPGAVTGSISVTTAGGAASGGSNFTVTPTGYPDVQQGNKLVATDGSGAPQQGLAVAVSADGNTAIVGGPHDNSDVGAAWIYTRSGGSWVQQGNKLVGSDYVNSPLQGTSVAISADGNTAIVGGPYDNSSIHGGNATTGAVWVYTRNNGVWTQQGNKLTVTDGTEPNLGSAVSISADGNTVIIGGDFDNGGQGAAWIFTRTRAAWSQFGSKLVGTGSSVSSSQGWAVSISADGTTAIVGGYGSGAWIYTLNGGTWTQQGANLSASDASAGALQGVSVSVSADGNTALIGGPYDNSHNGAAWVFIRNSGLWSEQGKLVGTGALGSAQQGWSMSVSADGNTAMVGGPFDNAQYGETWIYTRNGGVWAQAGFKLFGTNNNGQAQQGMSVALSADGATAFIGGPIDNTGTGAAWVFIRPAPPIIASFSPSSGPPGTLVTINGSNLTNTTAFTIGGVPALVIANTGSQLTGYVMPGATTGNISLTTQSGTATSSSNFTTTAKSNPYVQQGIKLAGTGSVGAGGAGTPQQGISLSVSADGNTAIVGGPFDNFNQGAAWVYTRSGGVWAQQGAKLVGAGNSGTSQQGYSVSLSADGNTALIGGVSDNGGIGAVWIFTRTGGVWTQQGNKLVGTGNTGSSRQGYSASLSADGNTALVGGNGDNTSQGAAWVFTRIGGVWSQQGNKLVGTGNIGAAQQGGAVSLSADGNTALLGGIGDNSNNGAAWVFALSNGAWTQQGNKLTGSGNIGAANLGHSVSLSADGSTALVGGWADNSNKGAVWVFTQNGGTWSQQGNKLAGTGNVGAALQGSVSVSADGNTAIVGGEGDNNNIGACWIFTRSGGTWTQQGSKLVGSGGVAPSRQGFSVSISGDGGTAITAGYSDNSFLGAVWAFVPGTTITSITATGSSPTNSATVSYSVVFGGPITGLTSGNFSVTNSGGISGSTIASVTGSGATYTVSVNTGSGDGTIALNLANNAGISPSISNALPFAGDTYTVDKTAPQAISGSFTSNNPSDPTYARIGDAVTVAFATNETIQTPVITIAGHSVTATNTGGNNWQGSYTMLSSDAPGQVPFTLYFSDLAGNAATPLDQSSTTNIVTFNSVAAPTITAGSFKSNNPYTNNGARVGDVVTLVFTTSKAIVTPTLTIAGHSVVVTNPSSDGINWSGSYTMTASDTEGLIPFTLIIADAQGNSPNGGAPYTASSTHQTLVFDMTPPSVVSINLQNPASAATVPTLLTYRVTFSEHVNNVTPNDFIITATGTATGNVQHTLAAPGNAIDVTVNNVAGIGTLRLDAKRPPFNNWYDDGGNPPLRGFIGGQSYNIIAMPSAVTALVTAITSTSATLNGTVNDNGDATMVTFTYGTASDLSGATTTMQASTGGTISAGSGNTPVALNITGLTAATTYYYRMSAANTAGTNITGIFSFTTSPPVSQPFVTTLAPATGITPSSATISGFVNSNGASTTVSFVYGTDPGLVGGTTIGATTNGNLAAGASGNAAVTLTGLTAATAYYFQVTATNSVGTTPGSIVNFTTAPLIHQNITFNPLPFKTYGDADFAPGATSDNNTIPVVYSSDNIAVATIVNGNIHIVGAGIANITALQSGSADYAAASSITQRITIGKASVTVTADAQSKTYGDADPALTYAITAGALVGADTFTGALTRDPGESAGTYAIDKGSLALSSNYILNYAGANFTISAKALTVTADAQSKTYGDADPALTYTVTGSLVGTDALTGALTRDAGENAGIYAIRQGTLTAGSNYSLSYTGANLTIGQKAITVTADAKNKTYGDADPALTYTISGALAGNDSFTGSLARDPGENAGIYAVNQGTLALNGNYVLTYAGNNLTIAAKAITITANAQSKNYGDADPVLTYTITAGALVGTDAFSGSLARDPGENIGTYAINQGTVALSSNYALTYVGANLTIGNRAITITADAQSKIYGDADPALTYKITSGSLLGNDSFTGSLTRDAGENTGVYSIKQGTLTVANYTVTFVGANLTIGQKPIAVAASFQTKVFGATDPALTYAVTSGSLIGGDAFTGSLTRDPGENVGTYVINQGTLSAGGNYQLSYTANTLTITSGIRTITFGALPAKVFNDADFSPGATASSGETIIYTSSNTAVAAIVSGKVHITGVGTTTITATVSANSNYSNIPSQSQALVVNKADQTISFSAIPVQNKGATYDLSTVTASSGLPVMLTTSDPAIASISGSTLTAVHLGSATITAAQGGNVNYNAATSVSLPVTISDAAGDEILVHQAVSPNGDGINDFLFIEGIQKYPDNKITIVNRNGAKIFELTGYDNASHVFDGHSNITGSFQQQGTYFYVLEYSDNGVNRKKTGFIVLKY